MSEGWGGALASSRTHITPLPHLRSQQEEQQQEAEMEKGEEEEEEVGGLVGWLVDQ